MFPHNYPHPRYKEKLQSNSYFLPIHDLHNPRVFSSQHFLRSAFKIYQIHVRFVSSSPHSRGAGRAAEQVGLRLDVHSDGPSETRGSAVKRENSNFCCETFFITHKPSLKHTAAQCIFHRVQSRRI